MGGTSKQSSTQTQNSTTAPWQPSQHILQGILGGINNQMDYLPTGAETGAINTMSANAQNAPNYAPQAQGLAADLMNGGTAANSGILSDAYKTYQQQLSPYANSMDPTQSPGMQDLLATIRGDVSNSVNGMFAGAGRDLSGKHAESLGRGMTAGMAAPLLNQYNQNTQNQMGAAGNLFNAGGQTAQGLQGFDQQGFANREQGLNIGNSALQMQNSGAQGILDAEAMRRNLPLQNLGGLLGLTLPIAGLGGQSTGTSNTQGSHTASPAQTAMMWGNAFKNFGFGG